MKRESASNKPRALVTGAAGFTGKYLVDELSSAGYDIFGTGHTSDPENRSLIRLDLCDRTAVKHLVQDVKPDVVVHLAGISFVAEGNTSRIYETNFLGSFHLLEALESINSHALRSVLLCSTANVYGNNPKETLDEDVIPEPINEYAVSKYAMEKMAKLWMNRLPIFIVRPFNYTGVGQSQKFLIPKIINHFKEKKTAIELGNLDVWREFGDVRSVVRAYRQLVDLSPVGHTFNICTGLSYSLREVITMCEELTGHKITVNSNPAFIRANEVRALQGDNSKLMKWIGHWEVANLKDTLEWMLKFEN